MTIQDRLNNTYYDKKGRKIQEGDLLKVFHFQQRGATGKKHFTHHVVCFDDKCSPPVLACRAYNMDNPHYRIYMVVDEGRVYTNAEIIDGIGFIDEREKIKITKQKQQHEG